MDRGDGVAEGGLHLSAVLLGGLDGLLQIAHIVERVENADDIDTVFDGLTAEGVHHIVGVVLVAQDILAAEEHLQLGLGQTCLQLAQALPGIFIEETHAAIEGGAAPALQRVVADGVQHFQGGHHVLDGHAGGSLGLVGVTQDGIGDQQGFIRQKFHSLYLASVNGTGRSARRQQWPSRSRRPHWGPWHASAGSCWGWPSDLPPG